ncbi:MAG: TOBE domain-containing protein, partial [Polyangiaceae bacterium]
LSNLDAKLRVAMRSEIQSLHSRLRTTSLYVTHDQVEAMTLADRAIVMNKGNVEQIGSPSEIYDRPATLFVANFIGSPPMNLLSGRLAANAASFQVDGGPTIPLGERSAISPASELVLGIRPENLTLTDAGGEPPLELTVDYCERLGAENLAYGRWGAQQVVVRLPHQAVPAPGEKLSLAARPSLFHLFDAASGKRVDG